MVREFRSPTGHLLGLPGGAIEDGSTPAETAVREFAEEADLGLDTSRLAPHGTRRTMGTLGSHSDHLFSVELTEDELEALRADAAHHGVGGHERTTVEVVAASDLDRQPNVDWATLGAVHRVLASLPTSVRAAEGSEP